MWRFLNGILKQYADFKNTLSVVMESSFNWNNNLTG